MTVAFQMVFVGVMTFFVEVAGIPVAAFAGSLRSEVHPDAELRLSQPFRCAGIVLFYRLPRRLERAIRNWNVELYLSESIDVA